MKTLTSESTSCETIEKHMFGMTESKIVRKRETLEMHLFIKLDSQAVEELETVDRHMFEISYS